MPPSTRTLLLPAMQPPRKTPWPRGTRPRRCAALEIGRKEGAISPLNPCPPSSAQEKVGQKRQARRFSKEEVAKLEEYFQQENYPKKDAKEKIAQASFFFRSNGIAHGPRQQRQPFLAGRRRRIRADRPLVHGAPQEGQDRRRRRCRRRGRSGTGRTAGTGPAAADALR